MPEDALNTCVAITLPCGVLNKEGKVERNAEIVPMTGRVRKLIARPEVRTDGNKIIDEILRNCLKRVGSTTEISYSLLQGLLGADRDYILLKIRQASSGNTIRSQFACPACRTNLNVDFNIDDIEVKELHESDYEVRDGRRVFYLDLSEYNVKALFRYPNGADQVQISKLAERNPVEAEYRIYQSCLVEWNGETRDKLGQSFIEDLPVRILDDLGPKFRDALAGPDMNLTVDCSKCGNENTIALETSDFLFPIFPRR